MNIPINQITPFPFATSPVVTLECVNIGMTSDLSPKSLKKNIRKKEEQHITFINFVFENFDNVSREKILTLLNNRQNDYDQVLYDLLD